MYNLSCYSTDFIDIDNDIDNVTIVLNNNSNDIIIIIVIINVVVNIIITIIVDIIIVTIMVQQRGWSPLLATEQ